MLNLQQLCVTQFVNKELYKYYIYIYINYLWHTYYIYVYIGLHGGSANKESTCNVGDLGSIPGLERSPGEGNGYPFQYSDLENSMNCTVYGVAKSWTRLSDFHFHYIYMTYVQTLYLYKMGTCKRFCLFHSLRCYKCYKR